MNVFKFWRLPIWEGHEGGEGVVGVHEGVDERVQHCDGENPPCLSRGHH